MAETYLSKWEKFFKNLDDIVRIFNEEINKFKIEWSEAFKPFDAYGYDGGFISRLSNEYFKVVEFFNELLFANWKFTLLNKTTAGTFVKYYKIPNTLIEQNGLYFLLIFDDVFLFESICFETKLWTASLISNIDFNNDENMADSCSIPIKVTAKYDILNDFTKQVKQENLT